MIDLSHLTEEEQEMIMTVLKRDSELKKAEEERIGKLHKVLNQGSSSETKLKHLTGEWFYEAKSRRHMDKIHGSEIILASMKQRKAGNLDGSLRIERPRATGSRGFDIVAPPKPARRLEITQPVKKSDVDAEKEKLNVAVLSPQRPRHNPFNRASQVLLEPSESDEKLLTNGNQNLMTRSDTEATSSLKNHTASQVNQLSGGSVTSEGSSVGFRPVPKKRTFLSRRKSAQSENDGSGPQTGTKVVVPAPRVSLQHGTSRSSNQSSFGEHLQSTTSNLTFHVCPSGQPIKPPNQLSSQPVSDASQIATCNKQDRNINLSSVTSEQTVEKKSDSSYQTASFKVTSSPTKSDSIYNFRTAIYPKNDTPTNRVIPDSERGGSRDSLSQREHTGLHTTSPPTARSQDPEKTRPSNVGTDLRGDDLSSTESSVDPPVRYDLNLVDKPDQHRSKKSVQKHVSKPSPQTPNPSGEEEDSIAKVLEWFSRSTDSNEWLDAEDKQQELVNTDRQRDLVTKDATRKDTGDNYEIRIRDRERGAVEVKRSHLQKEAKDDIERIKLSADRLEKKEVTEMQEEIWNGSRVQLKAQEVNVHEDESKPPKISHLKSFWEKGNTGPKILISRSNSTSEKGQKYSHLITDEDREREENQPHICDMHSGLCNIEGKSEIYTSNFKDTSEKEPILPRNQQQLMNYSDYVHSDKSPNQQVNYATKRDMHASTTETFTLPISRGYQPNSGTQWEEDTKYTTGEDRSGSDTEIVPLIRLSSQPGSSCQSRFNANAEMSSQLKLNPQSNAVSQAKGVLFPVKTSPCVTTPPSDDSSRASPSSQLNTNLPGRDSPDSEKLFQSKCSTYTDYQRAVNDLLFTPKMHQGSNEEVKRRDAEEKKAQSSASSKKQDETTDRDKNNSTHSWRQNPQCPESTAEKIKQLKIFWEQERNKPMSYTGKSKGLGDGKGPRVQDFGKLNKRFTKSEYDLRNICNDSGSDEEDSDKSRPNFTILSMNQRLEKLSPTLGAHRKQFKNLREFWGDATSNRRGSLPFEKPKSTKKNELLHQSPALDLQHCVDPDFYCKPSPNEVDKNKTVIKLSLPSQNRSMPSSDRQIGPSSGGGNDGKINMSPYISNESAQQRDSKRGSKDPTREEKSSKSQSNQGKETRSPKARKDSFGSLGSRGSSLRRATSMFSLNVADEDSSFPGQVKKTQESSPVQSRGRRQSTDRSQSRKQSFDKGPSARRASEDSEYLTPRARSFVPRDYRHYLGMTEKTSVHNTLAPVTKEQESGGKTVYDIDLSGSVRASTPVSSEERYGRTGNKTMQRPLWVDHSSTDTGRESSLSSISDTWSNSRNSSNRENDDDNQSPVRRALRRAEARPKTLAKSLEDITASIPPRQERRQDPIADLRHSSDVSSIPSPSSSSFSDPEHLKKMSKSVPSFLQKEVKPTHLSYSPLHQSLLYFPVHGAFCGCCLCCRTVAETLTPPLKTVTMEAYKRWANL